MNVIFRAVALLFFAAIAALADPSTTISLVEVWPDNTVTIHCVAGSVGGQNGMYIQTQNSDGSHCYSFVDCPLQPFEWGNIVVGDANHGCPTQCGAQYTFSVRQDTVQEWGNQLIVGTENCTHY